MGWKGRALAAALGVVLCASPALARQPQRVVAQQQQLSAESRQMSNWIRKSRDHGGRAFAIVDKREARIHVFDGRGALTGSSPILIGQAVGDDIAPDVGEHAQTGRVPLHERTTPAGRFESHPGRNLTGEHVVWVDYDSAFAIHRMRPGPGSRDREARLASPIASSHRVSLGCVVVPVRFYQHVIQPLLGRGRATVYVLPEQGGWRGLLDAP